MSDRHRLNLWEGYGLEIEYMIVDRDTLNVSAICDKLMIAATGGITNELSHDGVGWSNELTAHLVELKTDGPVKNLARVPADFGREIREINRLLDTLGARLMPGAVHPWMVPAREAQLWQHDNTEIYSAFDRIFDCRGPGWANLQSVHLNLPFDGDEQFARLHAAIRLILPIIPALSAGSPIVDARPAGKLDQRLEAYRHHCDKVPHLVGRVIPEPAFSEAEYRELVLDPIDIALKPYNHDGVFESDWSNARGAIARFDRGTIEIRVIDAQECPAMDAAIAATVAAAVRLLADEVLCDHATQRTLAVDPLADLFERTLTDAGATPVENSAYLKVMGASGPCTAIELWRHLTGLIDTHHPEWIAPHREALDVILNHGCLALRILRATGDDPDRPKLHQVYSRLCDGLMAGKPFLG